MSDRNFKLLQMFNDYLDNNKNLPSAMSSQQNIPDCPVLLNMSEEEKTRITIRKILDEEQEVYEQYQPFRPVLLNEVDYELKWFLKYNPSLNQEQPRESLILGKKLLQLIIKAQLFEAHSFKSDDVRILYCFFTEIKQPPTLKLIEVLDGIFSAALQQICTFSDRVSVMIDYQVREFIRDPNRAKRSILKSMLRHPELIPECWGSEAAQVRWRDGKEIERLRAIEEEKERQIVIAKELEEKEKKEREEKEKEEKEKEEKEKEEKEKEEKEKIKDKKKEEEKEEKKRKKEKEKEEKEKEKAEKKKKKEKEKEEKEREKEKEKLEKKKKKEKEKEEKEKKKDKAEKTLEVPIVDRTQRNSDVKKPGVMTPVKKSNKLEIIDTKTQKSKTKTGPVLKPRVN